MEVLGGDADNVMGHSIASPQKEGELGSGWRGVGPTELGGNPAAKKTSHREDRTSQGQRQRRQGRRGPETGALLWVLQGLAV